MKHIATVGVLILLTSPSFAADSLATSDQLGPQGKCPALIEAGTGGYDRASAVIDEMYKNANIAINKAKEERGDLSKCLGNLASLDFGVALGVQLPSLDGILSQLMDRACRFTSSEINGHLYEAESRLRMDGPFWRARTNLGGGPIIEVNTEDTSRYASECVWRRLNGEPAC